MSIHVRSSPPDGIVVLISRHEPNDPRLAPMLSGRNIASTIKMGSGLKLCRIAEGLADLYIRPAALWSGTLLLHRLFWRERVALC